MRERVRAQLFDRQVAVLEDDARYLVAHPGRRAGKTWTNLGFLLDAALTCPPDAVCPYIAPTRKRAKRIAWGPLHRLTEAAGVAVEYNNTDLEATLPHGAKIWIAGCSDVTQVEDFRGIAAGAAAIDEAGSFPSYLDSLINDALIPALADFGGRLLLSGTPPVAPVGFFYRAGYEQSVPGFGQPHHWTMRENAKFPGDAEREMRDVIVRRKWTEDHPTYRREWLGEFVTDYSMLVYDYHDGVLVEHTEPGPMRYILGVDLGWSETKTTTAFALVGYCVDKPITYVMRTWAMTQLTTQQIASEIRKVESEVGRLQAIVVDPGGLGSKYISELQLRERIAVQAAEKTDKVGFIQLMNSDMRTGRLRCVREGTEHLIGEWLVLPWADETRRKEKDGVPNHHSDATLYAWRRSLAFAFRPGEPARPAVGTPEASEDEERRMIEGMERRWRESTESKFWERQRRRSSRAARSYRLR